MIVCSDGIHDNLDPEFMGHSPSDCQLDAESWREGLLDASFFLS